MRILLANHTGAWSGAEVALMRLLEALPVDHDLAVACPEEGPLPDAVDRAGFRRLALPEVGASLRLHPVQTPVGVGQLGAAGAALARAASRFDADVVHANTLRTGLMGAIALRLGGPPVVVRAHEHLPLNSLGRSIRFVLTRSASAVVAVSDHTARCFNEGLRRPVATRVYNSIDHARFDPNRVAPARLREELGIASGAALLGQVAQITPWKGQETAIRALAELRRSGLDAHLVIAGQIAFAAKGVRFDNHRYRRKLERLVADLAVREAVHFIGQREDVPGVLRALDLSLLPSWDEPFGLVTVESMAMGTPPLVSSVGAGPELVEDGISGRVLPPRQPEAWAEAARELLREPLTLELMGERGRRAAAKFRDETQVYEMLAVYERALKQSPPSASRRSMMVPARTERARSAAQWPS
jgi:L-malate glycosyltransferase